MAPKLCSKAPWGGDVGIQGPPNSSEMGHPLGP